MLAAPFLRVRSLLVVAFLSCSAVISGVDGVCVEWDQQTCPSCLCCPTSCRSGYINNGVTGCTEYFEEDRSWRQPLESCSSQVCSTTIPGCSACSKECFNGNYLPSSGSRGSGGSLSCADRPIQYANRRCYAGSARTCKSIDGNGVCVCGANYRVQSNECVSCPTGYAHGAGDDPRESDTVCDVCAENFYVSANNTCTACPGTSTRPAGDNNTVGTVTACSCTSFTPLANVDISGSSCADGLLNVGEMCTGYGCISDAYDPSGLQGSITCGDDGILLNTATCSVCSQNHYVSGLGTCTPCPGDSTRPQGDDNSAGETTSCSCGAFSRTPNLDITSSSCSSGAIDVGHTCTGLRCPDGYLLEGSISCDNDGIISNTANCNKCDEDYYVSASGTCSRCPGSSTNQAGDDNTADSSTRCICELSPCENGELVMSYPVTLMAR